MKIRVLGLTKTDQAILKMKVDGLSDGAVSEALGVDLDHVVYVDKWVNRGLPVVWRKTAAECWKIIKEWNAASTLVLFLCLMPLVLDNNEVIRVRARPVRVARVARRKD